jgi:hypothetical protein
MLDCQHFHPPDVGHEGQYEVEIQMYCILDTLLTGTSLNTPYKCHGWGSHKSWGTVFWDWHRVRRFLQEPHGVTSQETPFFIFSHCHFHTLH